MSRTITDIITRDCGPGIDVPEGDGWLRMPCPYNGCTGERMPAAVNHDLGMFYCHHCHTPRSVDHGAGDGPLGRYAVLLHRAAWKAWQKFHGVFSVDDARDKASELLLWYAHGPVGEPNDSGKLTEWEAVGAEDKARAFVWTALMGDLLDHGRKLVTLYRHEMPGGLGGNRDDSPLLAANLDGRTVDDWLTLAEHDWLRESDYPYLYMWKVYGMTVAEMTTGIQKRDPGWSVKRTRQAIDREKRRLGAELYGPGQKPPSGSEVISDDEITTVTPGDEVKNKTLHGFSTHRSAHRTTVGTGPGYRGHRGRCSCRWQGDTFSSRKDAVADCQSHIAAYGPQK